MRKVMAIVSETGLRFEKAPEGSLVNVYSGSVNTDCFTNYTLESGNWETFEVACQGYLNELEEEE